MKHIDEVMFDERDGLNGRFRDGDYTLLPEEREVIYRYIDHVLQEAYENNRKAGACSRLSSCVLEYMCYDKSKKEEKTWQETKSFLFM